MIKGLSIDDETIYNNLGLIINSNFINLYKLDHILNNHFDFIYGYYDKNELVGFIHVTKLYENMDINNIVVSEKYRNKGIATALINFAISKFNDLKNVFLEVNDKNINAVNLYKKLGFKVIDVRMRYYGVDDALIMQKEVFL